MNIDGDNQNNYQGLRKDKAKNTTPSHRIWSETIQTKYMLEERDELQKNWFSNRQSPFKYIGTGTFGTSEGPTKMIRRWYSKISVSKQ